MRKNTYNTIQQNLIPHTSPSEWKAALAGINHGYGHTWENCYAMHLTTGMPTYLYTLTNGDTRVVCPIAERTYNGHTDVVTPYGFSGFTGNDDIPEQQQYWKQFAYDRGYVCGYIGLNPLMEYPKNYDTYDLHKTNTLYFLDLRTSLDKLYKNMDESRRRAIKKFEKTNKKITTDKKVLKRFFLTNYHAFFSSKQASEVYDFTYETLSCIIDNDKVFAAGVYDNDTITALSIYGFTRYGADNLFNISIGDGRKHTIPLLWFAINYLKSIHIPSLNLGGGVQKNDSIAKFKKQFGGIERPLQCLKQVYNEKIFSELCHAANGTNVRENGYFPPYRKPSAMTDKELVF